MFTNRQKLFLGGAVLLSVLLVAGSYFGSRWLFGPDIEPTPEHLLTAERSYATSVSHDTPSVSGADLMSGSEDELFSDSETQSDSTKIDEELEAQLAALSNEELSAFAEALEQDEGESSKYPAVPDGFPTTPVWLKSYFDEDLHANHVIIGRVLIELWNQGDHDFTGATLSGSNGRVYPIYPDVIYVEWDSYVREGPDGESIEVPYITARLGASSTIEPLLNSDNRLFTEEEILSGAYKSKFPGIRLVDYDSAGYDPARVLDDY
jgi:hypothetical protein